MTNDIKRITIDDWVLTVREPQDQKPLSIVFMIHGWTGDERSMWKL